MPPKRWERPEKNEFVVEKGGSVREAWAPNGFLQGNLHPQLRNPPTFQVNLPQGGAIQVHVRAVATLGARLECLVDGQLVKAAHLPDRDGKNDGSAPEYDQTFSFPISRRQAPCSLCAPLCREASPGPFIAIEARGTRFV